MSAAGKAISNLKVCPASYDMLSGKHVNSKAPVQGSIFFVSCEEESNTFRVTSQIAFLEAESR